MPEKKEKYKGGEYLFVVGDDVRHNPKRLTYKRAAKIHGKIKMVRVRAIGTWKQAHIEKIKLHDRVKLKYRPQVEGRIRYIDKLKKRVEFSHQGAPIFSHIQNLKVWGRKSAPRIKTRG